MKKLLALLFAGILCLTLAACNTGDGATGWAYVKDQGKLIVGLDDTFAPMGFKDENGTLVGFDIDLARAVGEELGVEIEFKSIVWEAKETELSTKRIDCIWNGMSATPGRIRNLTLTKKYLNNRIVIMAMDASVKIASVDDLKNYDIGTQADSAALETMQDHDLYSSFKDKIKEYPTYDEAILDMKAGRIQCMVVDEVLGEYKNSKLDDKMAICDFNFGDDFYAIGCRRMDTDLADKIDEALKKLIENGKAKTISEKWFGTDIVILEDYK